RRFLRASECATDHYCVRTASERFANIAAFAHSAVGNDWDVARSFFEVSVTRGGAIYRRGHLRHAKSKNSARSARCAGSDANQNTGRTAFHDFESDIIANRVADDHRNA